jgi:cytochrome c biogenesis protein CcmG/thiol:disulfide interchange protein DsbE
MTELPAPPSSTAPVAPPRPVRRRGVGPFSLRQVTIAIVAMMGAAIIGTLATRPLGTIPIGLPVPDPSAFLIGSPEPGLAIGDLAPELEYVDAAGATVQLTDLDGNPVRLADLRGKVVWINFWASWCPPCQYETPTLRTMDQTYRDRGLAIVGIQVQQTVAAGREYAERYDLEYTIGADVTGRIFHAYRVFALPTQFFVDANGVLRGIVNGPLDETRAAAAIDALLPPAAAASPSSGPIGSAPTGS